MNIEIRNDNDSRFVARSVQQFFRDNHLGQVFTHSHTPQGNAHIESFRAILSEKFGRYNFWSLGDFEQCLTLFYDSITTNAYIRQHYTCHLGFSGNVAKKTW